MGHPFFVLLLKEKQVLRLRCAPLRMTTIVEECGLAWLHHGCAFGGWLGGEVLHEDAQDFLAGSGVVVARLQSAFGPCQQENKRHPALGIVGELLADLVERLRRFEREMDGADLVD